MKAKTSRITFSSGAIISRIRMLGNILRSLLSLIGIDKKYRKVFAIGFNKTATSSIHTVFQKAGFLAVQNVSWRPSKLPFLLYRYQAISDAVPEDFKLLDQRFSGSKFILNVRNLDEWLDSRIEHIRFKEANGVVFTSKYWQVSEEAIQNWITNRNAHHLDVLTYFKDRPGDLLLVNYIKDPDAVKKISEFIGGTPVTGKPYSRSTPITRQANQLKNEALINTCFRALGVPPAEQKYDVYCPSLLAESEMPEWAANTEPS